MDELYDFTTIDDTADEAYSAIVESVTQLFQKEILMFENGYAIPETFMEATDDTPKKNIGAKAIDGLKVLWKRICEFFKWIGDGLRKLIQRIKSVFSKNKATSTPDQIAEKQNIKPIHLEYNNGVLIKCYIETDGVYISFHDTQKYAANKNALYQLKSQRDALADMFDEEDSNPFVKAVLNAMNRKYEKYDKLTKTTVPGQKWSVINHLRLVFRMLEDTSILDDFGKAVELIRDAMLDYGDKDPEKYHSVDSVKKIMDAGDIVDNIAKKYLNSTMIFRGHRKYSLNAITDFQKRFDAIESTFNEIANPFSTAGALKVEQMQRLQKTISDIAALIVGIPMAINAITNQLNDVYLIDAAYHGSVNDTTNLARFVSTMIDSGIPSKYVAYNAYIISAKELHGYGDEYAPVMGQSRCVFFPTNDKTVVYKLALNKSGKTANATEHDIYQLFKKVGKADLLAKFIDRSPTDALTVVERCVVSEPSYSIIDAGLVAEDIKSVCENELKQYHLRLYIDCHAENIGRHISTGKCCMIDYGYSGKYMRDPMEVQKSAQKNAVAKNIPIVGKKLAEMM